MSAKKSIAHISKAAKWNANEGRLLRLRHNGVEALVQLDVPFESSVENEPDMAI